LIVAEKFSASIHPEEMWPVGVPLFANPSITLAWHASLCARNALFCDLRVHVTTDLHVVEMCYRRLCTNDTPHSIPTGRFLPPGGFFRY